MDAWPNDVIGVETIAFEVDPHLEPEAVGDQRQGSRHQLRLADQDRVLRPGDDDPLDFTVDEFPTPGGVVDIDPKVEDSATGLGNVVRNVDGAVVRDHEGRRGWLGECRRGREENHRRQHEA